MLHECNMCVRLVRANVRPVLQFRRQINGAQNVHANAHGLMHRRNDAFASLRFHPFGQDRLDVGNDNSRVHRHCGLCVPDR